LTHAAVGQQMRAVESEFNCPLFDRSQRTITLLPVAYEMLPKIRQVLGLYDGLFASDEPSASLIGSVTIGAIGSALGPVSDGLIRLKSRHPALKTTLITASNAELPKLLRSGAVDAAVLAGSYDEQNDFKWQRLYDERFVLLAHPDFLRESRDIKRLIREHSYIRYSRATFSGGCIDHYLRERSIDVKGIIELDATHTIATLVRDRVGVAIVPLLRASDWESDSNLAIVELPNCDTKRTIGIAENGQKSHIVRELCKSILADDSPV
jgi:DNA-binding transcriptional LysR family regulator